MNTTSSTQEKLLVIGLSFYSASTLVAMAPMSIGAAVFLACLLASLALSGSFSDAFSHVRESYANRLYLKISATLALACAASLLFARIMPLSYGGRSAGIHFFRDILKLWYLIWPVLIWVALSRISSRGRAIVASTWLVTFGVLSIVGIIQHYTGWPRPQGIPNYPGHFHATMALGHHLSVASIWIFPFFACLDLLRANLARGWKGRSALLLAATLLGGATLFLTYSRTLWGALPLGILVWVLWSLPRRKALLVIAAFAAAGAALLAQAPIRDRLTTGIGITTRQDLWQANWEFFKARPLTGIGFRHTEEMSGYYLMDKYKTDDVFAGHAHNNFLEALGGMGAFGALAWLAWCGLAFALLWRPAWDQSEPNGFARGIFCAWIVFHVNGLTQVNFWEGKVQHQIALVMAWTLFWSTLREPVAAIVGEEGIESASA